MFTSATDRESIKVGGGGEGCDPTHTDACGPLLLVLVHVNMEAGHEEVQLGPQALVH